MKIASIEEKKEILLRILQRHPHLNDPIFHHHIEPLAEDTNIITQTIENQQFTTIFLTHKTIALFHESDQAFSLQGTPRFFKSIVIDAADHIVSVGFPHFFALQSFPENPEPTKAWSESFRFIEKQDGTCLLVTRYEGRYLVRSRRHIYRVSDSLEFLDFADYPLGGKLEALFSLYKDESFTVVTEAVFPRRANPETFSEFYGRVMRAGGVWSYVTYPHQNNFLIGIIYHDSLQFEKQLILDEVAAEIGLRRSRTWHFSNLQEAQNWVKKTDNHEGFCVYCNNDQSVFKFKTCWYGYVRSTVAELFHLLVPDFG